MWVLQLLCADHSTVSNVIRGAIPCLPEAQQLCRGAVGVNDVQEALSLTSPAKHSTVSCTAKPCLGAHSDWHQDLHQLKNCLFESSPIRLFVQATVSTICNHHDNACSMTAARSSTDKDAKETDKTYTNSQSFEHILTSMHTMHCHCKPSLVYYSSHLMTLCIQTFAQ